MPCDAIEKALNFHGALWELGQITALEILSNGVVQIPKGVASEFRVARVTKLLSSLVNVTLWESFDLGKIHNEI